MILSKEQCMEIISWNKEFVPMNVRECPEECHPSGLHKKVLDYNISAILRNTKNQWFFDSIGEYLKKEYPNNTVNKGKQFYLHNWEMGHKFTKHVDKRRDESWALVVGAILNRDFEGGRLLHYNPDGEVATNAGEIYVMSSEHLHEVTEITKGVRHSFVYFVDRELLGFDKTIL